MRGPAIDLHPMQNLPLGSRQRMSRDQASLQSVSTSALKPWAVKRQVKRRGDPLRHDVTSQSQLRGLQSDLIFDRGRR